VFQVSENTNFRFDNDFELPYTDTAELKSNQSVRATFRLSEKTILALSIVSNQLGVKQKSLFDHLISDTDALETIARELKKSNPKNLGGIQKTFVISRKTLSILKKMAKDHKASRDALVEFSIQRLKPIIEQEKSKLESRRNIAEKVKTAVESQKKLLDEATNKLGMEDPICEQLAYTVDRFESVYHSIKAFVQKSERVMELNAD
jgi:flagellar biosynthesis/type III secretory pathway chaperone